MRLTQYEWKIRRTSIARWPQPQGSLTRPTGPPGPDQGARARTRAGPSFEMKDGPNIYLGLTFPLQCWAPFDCTTAPCGGVKCQRNKRKGGFGIYSFPGKRSWQSKTIAQLSR